MWQQTKVLGVSAVAVEGLVVSRGVIAVVAISKVLVQECIETFPTYLF